MTTARPDLSALPDPTRVPMLIGGEWRFGEREYEVVDPIAAAWCRERPNRPRRSRRRDLRRRRREGRGRRHCPATGAPKFCTQVGALLAERVDEIAEIMTRETGKALKDSAPRSSAAKDTIRLSAEEAVRIQGEHVPLDATAMGAGKIAMMLRFPVGVVAAITPFNAPFNLAAHKVGPAIAAGNTIVLKPPPQAPLIVHKLVGAVRRRRRAGGLAERGLRRRRRPAPGPRPARRLRHLHRLDARRRGDQGRLRPASAWRWNSAAPARPSSMRTPISTKPRRSAPATPCGSPARAASRCRTSTSTRPSTSLRRRADRRGRQAEVRRSARSRHRRRHADRRGGGRRGGSWIARGRGRRRARRCRRRSASGAPVSNRPCSST